MNKRLVARELVKIAKSLVAVPVPAGEEFRVIYSMIQRFALQEGFVLQKLKDMDSQIQDICREIFNRNIDDCKMFVTLPENLQENSGIKEIFKKYTQDLRNRANEMIRDEVVEILKKAEDAFKKDYGELENNLEKIVEKYKR